MIILEFKIPDEFREGGKLQGLKAQKKTSCVSVETLYFTPTPRPGVQITELPLPQNHPHVHSLGDRWHKNSAVLEKGWGLPTAMAQVCTEDRDAYTFIKDYFA